MLMGSVLDWGTSSIQAWKYVEMCSVVFRVIQTTNWRGENATSLVEAVSGPISIQNVFGPFHLPLTLSFNSSVLKLYS